MTQGRYERKAGQDLRHACTVQLEAFDGPVATGDGMGQSHGDLVLPHVADNVEHCRARFGDRLVCYSLELKIELLEEIFKQQREKLTQQDTPTDHQ